MTDLNSPNPVEATPPGENLGTAITSTTVSSSNPAPATAQTVTTPPVIPTEVKETFLQKVGVDIHEAWAWLEAELAKL